VSLNEKQQTFALEYARTNNGTQSAKTAGYSNPKQYSYHLLNNPAIKQEIDKIRQEQDLAMQAQFRAGAVEAFNCLMEIIRDKDKNDQHRVSASKDLLDRAGFKATIKTENSIEVNYLDTMEELDNQLHNAIASLVEQRRPDKDIIESID